MSAEMPKALNKDEWALLALYYADKPLTPVQIQKILFLFGQAQGLGERAKYQFKPWDYGPYSPKIYSDLETAAYEFDLVEITEGKVRTYKLTPEGEAAAEKLDSQADAELKDYLEKVTEWAKNLSFAQIVKAVYDAFPEYKERSIFRA